MSEEHAHEIRYTIHLEGCWWQSTRTLILVGTGSSLKDGELLIHSEGGFTSINFSRVLWMRAEEIGHG